MLHLHNLIDNARCYEEIRRRRWPYQITCLCCGSNKVAKRGRNHRHQECRRYRCTNCGKQFDDLSGTIFAGRHQPLKVWFGCIYLMGLNLSSLQIAEELGLDESDALEMTSLLRKGVVTRRKISPLSGEVEIDEVYVIAGHKGRPDKVLGRKGRRNRLKGARGRGTLAKEKPPILGMIERGGDVHIIMLENVQQKTIAPILQAGIEPGTLVYTDEYDIYARLPHWGYTHKTVCHARGEYARDEDGDGFHEVHVNTMEGFWSLEDIRHTKCLMN